MNKQQQQQQEQTIIDWSLYDAGGCWKVLMNRL